MHLVICTKRDLVSAVAMNRLLQSVGDKHQITLILSDKVSEAERGLPQEQDFVFFERDLAVDLVFDLLDSLPEPEKPQPDLGNEDAEQKLLTFSALAKRYDALLLQWGNINSAEHVAELSNLAPDVLISVRYNYIFKAPVLASVQLATLNLHPGLLPQFAGMYAPFHALNQGCNELGCTLHYIDDEAIDAGAIISQSRYTADIDKSVMWHFQQCYQRGMDLLSNAIESLEQGDRPDALVQDQSQKAYYSYPTEQEFTAFRSKGGTLIKHRDFLSTLERFR